MLSTLHVHYMYSHLLLPKTTLLPLQPYRDVQFKRVKKKPAFHVKKSTAIGPNAVKATLRNKHVHVDHFTPIPFLQIGHPVPQRLISTSQPAQSNNRMSKGDLQSCNLVYNITPNYYLS